MVQESVHAPPAKQCICDGLTRSRRLQIATARIEINRIQQLPRARDEAQPQTGTEDLAKAVEAQHPSDIVTVFEFEPKVAFSPRPRDGVGIRTQSGKAEKVVRIVFEQQQVVFADDGEYGTLALVRSACARWIRTCRGRVEELGKGSALCGGGSGPVGKQLIKSMRLNTFRVGGCFKHACLVRHQARQNPPAHPTPSADYLVYFASW